MNTLKLGLSVLEIDENENQINNNNFDLLFDYNLVSKVSLILPPNEAEYTNVSLENMISPFLALISSTDDINYKLNGDTYINSKRSVVNASISSLSVYNPNAHNVTVDVYIYGVSNV